MRELTDIDAAYIAGLVDGEGCLSIVRQKNSNCRGGFAYRCGFRIASSNQSIMEWLSDTIGAGCVKSHQPKMRNSKRQWSLDLWSDDAAALTTRLLPFLRIKRPNAELLLAFQNALTQRVGVPLTDPEIAFRDECYHKSRALNQRGLKPYTPEGRVFSLRSSDDGADVAEVAKQYGGGGHRNAAGFRVSFAQAQAFEI